MSFESSIFYELMPDTVTISTRTTMNNYGEPSFASGTSVRARVVEKQGMIRASIAGDSGRTIEFTHIVWAHSTGNTAAVDDRISLDGVSYLVIKAVERYPDGDGAHHVKYLLGR